MCSVCDEGYSLDTINLSVKIKGDKLILDYDAYTDCHYSFDEEIQINFCMNCGKDVS
jgi:hypothetical protein